MLESYHQGQKIRCRGEEWQVINAVSHAVQTANGESNTIWEVEAEALSGLVKGEKYVFLSDLDQIELVDPSDIQPVIDDSRSYRKTRTFLEAHLRRLLPRNGAIYLGQHGAYAKNLNYQLTPASMALNMLRPRILIGDAVGLGKTIECGILLSELIRRGKARRVLAAVPKAILEQFQLEMWGRFSIPFHRLDSKGLERLRQDLPSTMNPFFHFDKAIISIDTLKLKKYQKLLEDCQWDVLIIDEAHNVSDRTDGMGGSARHRVSKRLAQNSRSVVLMSATPHDGTKYGFASLIKLLDRTLIPSDEDYSPTDIKDVFIRRTRTSVSSEVTNKRRVEKVEKIPLTANEVDLLQRLHDVELVNKTAKGKSRRGVRELFKTTLIKSFLSSPQALAETVAKKIKDLDKKLTGKSDGREREYEQTLQSLKSIEADIDGLKGKFSRLDRLTKFIKEAEISNDSKIVIFTERIATMNLLRDTILNSGFAKALFSPKEDKQPKGPLLATAHGSDTDVDLNKVVKAFQSKKSGVNILVTTNVASEGLNLHDNCHRLVHFDLPWSLITLEQRNGRIDRLGQEKQPQIFYFASVAGPVTRESKQEKLKDDFWIGEKIESRINQAAEDMDEESRRIFTSGEEEESKNTSDYENEQLSQPKTETSFLDLFSKVQEVQEPELGEPKRKALPTLFESSPGDFVEALTKEVDLKVKSTRNEIAIQMSSKLKHEVNERWPREFKPQDENLVLEPDKLQMEKHYRHCMNAQEALDKTFMNEIHPAINLLEHTAMSLFPGQEVPLVQILGNPGSVYFLLQGTLYNKLNEAVFQSWQVIEFEKGKSEINKFVDLNEPEHTNEIASWVREALDTAIEVSEVSPFTQKRINNLTPQALEWMSGLVSDARTKRAEKMKPKLKSELDRINTWVKSRKDYLQDITSSEGKAKHQGFFAQAKKAEDELVSIDKDTKQFKDFITNCIMTQDSPDVRILAIFTAAE